MAEVTRIGELRVTVEERPDYLFILEGDRGPAGPAYHDELERLGHATGRRRVLIDRRGRGPDAVLETVWAWVAEQDAFAKIALVLEDELAVAECNMNALAQRYPLRAFPGVPQAERWLFRERRQSTARHRRHEVAQRIAERRDARRRLADGDSGR
jgi:hypothetical protein